MNALFTEPNVDSKQEISLLSLLFKTSKEGVGNTKKRVSVECSLLVLAKFNCRHSVRDKVAISSAARSFLQGCGLYEANLRSLHEQFAKFK